MRSRVPLKMLSELITQQPQLIWLLIRNLVRKHFSVGYDYHFGNGHSKNPRQISLKITNKCNLRCKMCGQWGESGYNLDKPKEEINRVVPLDIYKQMVDQVAPDNPIFYIWGGEPFLYPDMMPLLWHLKEHKLTTTIVTNGIQLRDNAADLVDMQLDGLLVSLDGTEDVHNNIRGWDNCYAHLMEGLEKVREIKAEKKSLLPYIAVLITISQDNMHQLEEIFEEAAKAGADAVICYYAWFTNPVIGRQHVEVMEQRLDVTPTSWEGYLLPYANIDTAMVTEQVRRIDKRRWPFPYMFLPDLAYDQIPQYYADPAETFSYAKCAAPWLVTEIMPNGDVATCRDYPDYVTGNIMNDNLLEIWNNERSQRFRQTLKDEGLLPICARCCGLMGF